MIYKYLPEKMLRGVEVDELDFDDFFKLLALANISREMSIEDIEVGANKGCVASFGGEGGD